mmetsp:Transcript_35542/g.51936  ORF Transcript_35542/g.51936 Transcript_35542/m.51936 type:complete len:80 (-) Transcript_35542:46-285(-)
MQGHVYGKHTHSTFVFFEKRLECLVRFSLSIDIFERSSSRGSGMSLFDKVATLFLCKLEFCCGIKEYIFFELLCCEVFE